ncbi:YHS domain-containing protein [Thiohalophilus thiocyanatoxydans]|uniref:YHS domain-containing protein n=1 Tax=Thiohalophilus thiocyanatoxydans TaxID=381308 RepID=A0A4R8IQM2_9GAMM|nr:YHS domain-containing protein [Thiohalophilus thiocyanatoxydans]TDY02878.1 YHS domain-containing protein [Thiohalophilus thiocyanatoxydans]
MQQEQDKLKDPVCGMLVPRDKYAVDYLDMHFAFCSQQCQSRFLANPNLYIGKPGHPSHKDEVIKRRRLKLSEALSSQQSEELVKELGSMMGIKQVTVMQEEVEITYDLLQATAEQVEHRIVQLGGRPGNGMAEKLRRAFVHYLEETEVDSLEGSSSSHGHHH